MLEPIAILLPAQWALLLPALAVAAAIAAGVALGLWGLGRWLRQWVPTPDAARLIRNVLTVVAAVVVVLILVRGEGWGAPNITWRQVSNWVMGPGLHILFIFVGAFVAVRLAGVFIGHLQRVLATPELEPRNDFGAGPSAADAARPACARPGLGAPGPKPGLRFAERRKRVETVGRLLRGMSDFVIVGIALLMALRQVDVDITPILTGAGVAGVAVGLGAQTVVRDLIVGIFLILESQIRVGDVITINGKTGLVEALRLRIIVMRAEDGAVHVFHNGAINEYANLTKDYSYAVLDVVLPYQSDFEQTAAALQALGTEMAAEAEFNGKLRGSLEVLGIESLSGASMTVRIRQRTAPMEQWGVDRELRRRIHARYLKDAVGLAASP